MIATTLFCARRLPTTGIARTIEALNRIERPRMAVTVGKYEVRCQAFGGISAGARTGAFTGQWSIYLCPVGDDAEPLQSGVSDPFDNAGDAKREGMREGIEQAKSLDVGTTHAEPS